MNVEVAVAKENDWFFLYRAHKYIEQQRQLHLLVALNKDTCSKSNVSTQKIPSQKTNTLSVCVNVAIAPNAPAVERVRMKNFFALIRLAI